MNVTIRVGQVTSRIENGVLTPEATNALSESCSWEVPGQEYMKKSAKFKGKEWDGRKKLYHKGHRTFPSGLLERVCFVLRQHGYTPVINEADNREPVRVGLPAIGPEWALRDYQQEAAENVIVAERCMLRMATGGGKTPTAGHIIGGFDTYTIFLVHTKDLMYQAIDTFRSMFGEANVGQIGDGIINPSLITVCTVQTAARSLDVEYEHDSYDDGLKWDDEDTDYSDFRIGQTIGRAGCVIMDECHHVAADTATDVLSRMVNARYRVGLSASPWRDDGADLALEGAFGHVVHSTDASYLIKRGYLVRPIIRIKQTPLMRFPKGTKFPTIYSEGIEYNEARNCMGVLEATKMVKRGLPTLVLVKNIAHGRAIAIDLTRELGFDVPFLSGKDDSRVRKQVIQDMRDGHLTALVATTIADEGLDIKPLAGLVLLGGGKSSTRALQRIGRVLRPHPGKTRAEVVDFDDNVKYLVEHSAARIKMYNSESEFVITDV